MPHTKGDRCHLPYHAGQDYLSAQSHTGYLRLCL